MIRRGREQLRAGVIENKSDSTTAPKLSLKPCSGLLSNRSVIFFSFHLKKKYIKPSYGLSGEKDNMMENKEAQPRGRETWMLAPGLPQL